MTIALGISNEPNHMYRKLAPLSEHEWVRHYLSVVRMLQPLQ